jgi:DNA-binding CsgD family transcriptional regulator
MTGDKSPLAEIPTDQADAAGRQWEPALQRVTELHELYLSYEEAGRRHEGRPFLLQAVSIGSDSSACTEALSRAQLSLARDHLKLGDVPQAFATLDRVRTGIDLESDNPMVLWVAAAEAQMLLTLGRVHEVLRHGATTLQRLRGDAGLVQTSQAADTFVIAMGEAALAVGDVAMACALVDMCDGAETRPDDAWAAAALRSQIDIACGRLRDARRRTSHLLGVANSTFESRTRLRQIQAEMELWSGESANALEISRQALDDIADADDKGSAGNVLNLAMRACADLHQVGISQRANRTVRVAKKAAGEIRQMADSLNPVETVMHSSSVVADAEVTEWQAELARFQQLPHAVGWWHAAAASWERLGRPHRAAYARWRQAQALLGREDRPGAGDNLRHAWRQAIHHEPLRSSITELAHTAGLSRTLTTAGSVAPQPNDSPSGRRMTPTSERVPSAPPEARPRLTVREREVMHLVAEGLTSEQIGRRLGIAERTVRKHLSAVYAKAGLNGRAAAGWWQRGEGQGLR